MTTTAPSTRDRILAAAMELLDQGGPEAMSTRAVGAAARVQAPTIYRLFGDKQGLLDAVTEARFAEYLAAKTDQVPSDDPVEDMRRGWDRHVEFGLAHPAVYTAMYGNPRPGDVPRAVRRGEEMLLEIVGRIAAAGRLRLDVPTAASMVTAAGRGTVLLLIGTPPAERDMRLATLNREAVVAAITTDPPRVEGSTRAADDEPGAPVAAAARTVRAALPHLDALTPAERTLMAEWLDRLATG